MQAAEGRAESAEREAGKLAEQVIAERQKDVQEEVPPSLYTNLEYILDPKLDFILD